MIRNPSLLAVVVIGRNEGERLRRCIDTLIQNTKQVIYVDSGSTDGSVQMARSRQVHVVDLDMSMPFSAARARNAGFEAMRQAFPAAQHVQFVDGDCDVHPQWLDIASAFLDTRPDVVAVYGKLSERHPEASIYNLQCHLTWNPNEAGETDFFGGNFMALATAIEAAGGFKEDVIDSEDHELAVRLRIAGGKIWYLSSPMATHDLAMHQFSQWWRRTARGGYGNGQMVTLHRQSPGRPHQHAWYRSWFWGLWWPLLIVALVLAVGPWGLLPVGMYGLSFVRTYLRTPEQGGRHARFALLSILGKFAEMSGQIKFLRDRFFKRRATIIEYK